MNLTEKLEQKAFFESILNSQGQVAPTIIVFSKYREPVGLSLEFDDEMSDRMITTIFRRLVEKSNATHYTFFSEIEDTQEGHHSSAIIAINNSGDNVKCDFWNVIIPESEDSEFSLEESGSYKAGGDFEFDNLPTNLFDKTPLNKVPFHVLQDIDGMLEDLLIKMKATH